MPFFRKRNELAIEAGCILWGSRLIIPSCDRTTLLSELHEGHVGASRVLPHDPTTTMSSYYEQSWALNTFLYLNTKYMLKMYLNTKYFLQMYLNTKYIDVFKYFLNTFVNTFFIFSK